MKIIFNGLEIKNKSKQIVFMLASHAFLSMAILILASLIFGFCILYLYGIDTHSSLKPQDQEQIFFRYKEYNSIVEAWKNFGSSNSSAQLTNPFKP